MRIMAIPVYIRRAHRIFAPLWLLAIALAIAVPAAGGGEAPMLTTLAVILLIPLVLTGSYLLVQPWVQRFRAR